MTWAGLDGVRLSRGGWDFFMPNYDARFSEETRERLLDKALAAVDGTLAKRIRRSRHAETWMEHLDGAGHPPVYFKVLDPLRGAHRLRSRRTILRALGAQLARLHRAGYIHGDLTPYNVFVMGLEPPQFAFIDHERTRDTILSRLTRPRIRNLVQLGSLDVAGITNTDRMRVWCGYASTSARRRGHAERRRLASMLQRRIAHDRKAGVAHRASVSMERHPEAT